MAIVITTGLGNRKKIGKTIPDRPLFSPGDFVADGRYQVIAVLGEGSFGQVYQVRECATGAIRAMKRARHVKSRRLFASELKNLSRLQGVPHVLPLCDYFVDDDDSDVIVTEYLDGGNLKGSIMARGRLTIVEAIGVLDQMTQALSAAHALNPPILHRDIKPSNILAKKIGENRVCWYLSDWGLAVDWRGSGEPVVSGTYSYTAPEVWEQKRYPVSDVYSLGMSLYFMLFGRPAYEGGSTSVRRLQRAPDPVVIVPSCPPRLRILLEGMLTKDPGQRWSLQRVITHIRGRGQRPQGFAILQTRMPPGRLMQMKISESTMDFSWIPAGSTIMPDPPVIPEETSELRQPWVLRDSLWMARHPVTRGHFALFIRETGTITQAQKQGWGWIWDVQQGRFVVGRGADWQNPGFNQGDDHPVVLVSYQDAMAYIRWLAIKTGRLMFLPSQSQWEVACRAGGSSRHAILHETLPDQGSIDLDGIPIERSQMAPVQTTAVISPFAFANAWGLVDMHGNVFEWTRDRGTDGLDLIQVPPRTGDNPSEEIPRIVRGGGWMITSGSVAANCRGWVRETDGNNGLGFRVAGLALSWET